MAKCIFAGTFDPMTKGHVELIKRLKREYDSVLVVIGNNPEKSTLFSLAERKEIAKRSLYKIQGVRIIVYDDYKENYSEFLQKNDYTVYARGIRNAVDLEYEKKGEEINKKVYPFIETVYIDAKGREKDISSSLVRDKIKNGKDYKRLVSKKAYFFIKEVIKR
jgi:pantetheine-phosphate adenylyltransferase